MKHRHGSAMAHDRQPEKVVAQAGSGWNDIRADGLRETGRRNAHHPQALSGRRSLAEEENSRIVRTVSGNMKTVKKGMLNVGLVYVLAPQRLGPDSTVANRGSSPGMTPV